MDCDVAGALGYQPLRIVSCFVSLAKKRIDTVEIADLENIFALLELPYQCLRRNVETSESFFYCGE